MCSAVYSRFLHCAVCVCVVLTRLELVKVYCGLCVFIILCVCVLPVGFELVLVINLRVCVLPVGFELVLVMNLCVCVCVCVCRF